MFNVNRDDQPETVPFYQRTILKSTKQTNGNVSSSLRVTLLLFLFQLRVPSLGKIISLPRIAESSQPVVSLPEAGW